MSLFTPFFVRLKTYNYSILTALIIGLVTAIYLLVIVPNNEIQEDTNNLAVFRGFEVQLKNFFDDKVKEISSVKRDSIIDNVNSNLRSDSVFIDKIAIKSLDTSKTFRKKLELIREIYFKKRGVSTTVIDTITDTVNFDLDEFIKRLDNSSNFNSFFICPVIKGKCLSKDILISQNISLKDEDSLLANNRNTGTLTFDTSSNRYYTSQVKIPDTDFTLFVAAGINTSYFKSNVQYVKPNILIFSLLLLGILFLSICFLKPIVSSDKERLSQIDLITVAFSTGALIALFVIYGMVNFWKSSISERNKSDLKQMVEHIDTSFANQIDTLQFYKKNILDQEINASAFPFKKLYIENHSKISLIDGDSLTDKSNFSFNNRSQLWNVNSLSKKISFKEIEYLDSYFWMDKDGLLTASLSKDDITFARKYNDRKYFKLLQNKEINLVLTGVFSRESNQYQWIYAEKDTIQNQSNVSGKTAIKGIGFREHFSKQIKLPPDTDYMLVDRNGFVLMQSNPDKNLYQNVRSGSHNNLILESILAGCQVENFRMDYQGVSYQVFAKRLSVPADLPVYILGMRSLSYLDYLSLFTFNNAFLLTIFYGFLIVLLTLIYSSLFYSGRLSFFSRRHFYHLFPDNSRKGEYLNLFYLKIICFLAVILIFFLSTPTTALFFCLLIGVNITLVNVIVLNIRSNRFTETIGKFYLLVAVFGIGLPLWLLYMNQLYFSLTILFISHIGFILYYRNWRNREDANSSSDLLDAVAKNTGVQRKAYLKFLTSGILNYFVLFPFILVCAFYSNEINDYARYYCSPTQPILKVANHKVVNVYGCDCKALWVLDLSENNSGIIHKLNFGLEQPTMGEVSKFKLKELLNVSYIRANTIFNNIGFDVFYFLLSFGLIIILAYSLLNYYCNLFFFFDLMQASHEGYYPGNKNPLSNEYIFMAMVNDNDIKSMIQKDLNKIDNQSGIHFPDRTIALQNVFDTDSNNEILPFMKMDFILNSNLKEFDAIYSSVWDSIGNIEMQNVLYDFAQDHFVNYKNKETVMKLMDLGIINHDKLTGRLKIMSYSFRVYVMYKSKKDSDFVQQFNDESKNGTFDKLKLPILIIAVSLLLLLMYLNKDSYEKIMILGSSIGSALLLINKFLDLGKT